MAREPVKSSDLNDRLGVLERVNEACPLSYWGLEQHVFMSVLFRVISKEVMT